MSELERDGIFGWIVHFNEEHYQGETIPLIKIRLTATSFGRKNILLEKDIYDGYIFMDDAIHRSLLEMVADLKTTIRSNFIRE